MPNKQQRRSTPTSTSPPLVDPTPSRQSPPLPEEPVIRTQVQPARESLGVPSRPTIAPRSKTQPLPSLTIPTRKPMKEIPPSMSHDRGSVSDDFPAGEICVSPSWSDFGNSKKKKEKKRLEREKKEQEKTAKKVEKEQQAAAKAAGKRLSKRPPPAAMETQRMPAALRPAASPQPDSTLPSKENSRSSSRRSSFNDQDPNSEITIRPSSSRNSFRSFFNAPQLSKIFQGTRSRSGSTGSQNTFAEGEREYLKDLINYADEQSVADDIETQPQPLKPRTRKVSFSFDANDTAPVVPINSKVELPWMASEGRRGSNSSASSLVLKSKGEGKYRHPSSPGTQPSESMLQDTDIMPAAGVTTRARDITPKPEREDSPREQPGSLVTVKTSPVVPTRDGGSYVQKHRMYQQQRSIAGYEDELALARFNDLTAAQITLELEKQRLPPTPSDSLESLNRPKQSNAQYTDSQEAFHVRTLEEVKADEFHFFLSKQPLHPPSFGSGPPPSPKGEKASGVSRRPKIASPSMSTTSSNTITKISNAGSSPFRPVSPPSPVSPETVALVTSISKAERVLGIEENNTPSPPPKSANRSSRRMSDKWGIGTAQQPLAVASTPSLKTEEALKSRRTSSPDPASNGPQSLPIFPTCHSPPMDDALSSHSWRALDNVNRLSSSRGRTSTSTISSVDSIPTPQHASSKPIPEVIIEGIDGDGITRRASIKRPRSQPQLQDSSTTTQDLSFLPELKHQALVKPDRKSPTASLVSSRSSFGPNPPPSSSSSSDKHSLHSSPQFPTPSPPSTRPSSDDGISLPLGASSLNYTSNAAFRSPNQNNHQSASGLEPRSLLRPGSAPRRSTMSPPSSAAGPGTVAATQMKPLAKMFVICCKCKFWHDLPSALYKEMAMSRQIVGEEEDEEHAHGAEDTNATTGTGGTGESNRGRDKERRGVTSASGKIQGRVETRVQCPWCEHGMSTSCCAGWSCVVYLHERHH